MIVLSGGINTLDYFKLEFYKEPINSIVARATKNRFEMEMLAIFYVSVRLDTVN